MTIHEIPVPGNIDRPTFSRFMADVLAPNLERNKIVTHDKGKVTERNVVLWDDSGAPKPTNQELLGWFTTWRAANTESDVSLDVAKKYLTERLQSRLVRHIGLKVKPRVDALPTITKAAVQTIIDEEVDAFIARIDP